MKQCKDCQIFKENSEFYRCRTTADHLRQECKECHKLLGLKWRNANRIHYQKKNKEWYSKNRDYRTMVIHQWQNINKEKRYKNNQERAWRNLGIIFTVEKRQQLLKEQNGRCAICNVLETDQKRRFALDHDHNTGKIRALLCDLCNVRIVAILENHPDLVLKAQEYLQKHDYKNLDYLPKTW